MNAETITIEPPVGVVTLTPGDWLLRSPWGEARFRAEAVTDIKIADIPWDGNNPSAGKLIAERER